MVCVFDRGKESEKERKRCLKKSRGRIQNGEIRSDTIFCSDMNISNVVHVKNLWLCLLFVMVWNDTGFPSGSLDLLL